MSTQLFRTCRRIYDQALPLFYKDNIFYIDTAEQMEDVSFKNLLIDGHSCLKHFDLIQELRLFVSPESEGEAKLVAGAL